MSPEESKIAAQLLGLLSVPVLYHGYRLVFDKAYYMRIMEGYIGKDFTGEYNKLPISYRQYRRFKNGAVLLTTGFILLGLLVFSTFLGE